MQPVAAKNKNLWSNNVSKDLGMLKLNIEIYFTVNIYQLVYPLQFPMQHFFLLHPEQPGALLSLHGTASPLHFIRYVHWHL